MGQAGSKESEALFEATLKQLSRERVRAKDDLWQEFLQAGLNHSSLADAVSFQAVLALADAQPANAAVLLYKLANRLQLLIDLGARLSEEQKGQLEKGLQLLARLVPPMFVTSNKQLPHVLFWTEGELRTDALDVGLRRVSLPQRNSASPSALSESSEIAEGTTEKKSTEEEEATTASDGHDTLLVVGQENATLAAVLVAQIVRSLFLPGFTVTAPPTWTSELGLAWAVGVGVDVAQASTAEMISRRTAGLECLLAVCSKMLYHSGADGLLNGWLDLLTRESNYTSVMLYSLINVSLSYDPVGWGLPYNYVLGEDVSEKLSARALQVLAVLLSHKPALDAPNAYVLRLQQVKMASDLQFIFNGLQKLLSNPLSARSTYLPGSAKAVDAYQELLILFWMLVLENKLFLQWMLKTQDVAAIVSPLLFFMVGQRKDEGSVGFVHLCAFTLLVLSGERTFGIHMNKDMKDRVLPQGLPVFTGSYHDYIILGFYCILVDGHPKLASLQECLLTVICNLSPYISKLSMVASMRLMKLFCRYAAPRALLSYERYHRFVQFLLETFNNLIQYQYSGNQAIVYAVMQNATVFRNLANLRIKQISRDQHAQGDADSPKEEQSDDNEDTTGDEESTSGTEVLKETKKEAEEEKDEPQEAAAVESKKESPEALPAAAGSQQVRITTARWVPTNEWLQEWKAQLPISTCLRLISAILPDLPKVTQGGASDEDAIIKYLNATTLVGLLPVPHPILIRRYQQNAATELWLQRYIWGVVVTRARETTLFAGSFIKFFQVY